MSQHGTKTLNIMQLKTTLTLDMSGNDVIIYVNLAFNHSAASSFMVDPLSYLSFQPMSYTGVINTWYVLCCLVNGTCKRTLAANRINILLTGHKCGGVTIFAKHS